jgi:prepilin-type N-terminal cleavage/methylation domain-containing protein
MIRTRTSNLGFNLIEVSIVLGIVGIIVGGVFAAYSSVSENNRLRKGADQVTMIVQQVRNAYANRNALESASGVDFTNALIGAELIPMASVVNNTIKNAWGGNVLVTPETPAGSSANDGLNISFSGITPLSECRKFATNIFGLGRGAGLYMIDSTPVNQSTAISTVQAGSCGTDPVSFHYRLKAEN